MALGFLTFFFRNFGVWFIAVEIQKETKRAMSMQGFLFVNLFFKVVFLS